MRCHYRAQPEQSALFRQSLKIGILPRLAGQRIRWDCGVIRAVHMAGPAPSGDFWFLLVASKGTRRRQGIWGDVDSWFYLKLTAVD